ncbi:hypothetical protein EDD11_001528 [Mortierella claussenii]|nr:hypothetical protein EDD11_001528 [Mortierella claussenii]
MAVSSIAGSITARTAKQHQQHKESSLNVRNSMSHMVSVPGFTPLSTAPHSDPRHYSSDNSSPAGQSKFGSTHVSQSGARHHRSGSDSASTSGLSPAAMRLLRQQEQQKQLEKGEESFPKGTGHTRHGSHQTDDEDYRRTGARSAGNRSGSARSHHQRRTSDSGHVSGYESSSRQPSSARYLKSESHAMAMANDNNSSQRKGGGVDASAFTMLYKEIRDSMDAISFGLFARVVTSFNEGDKTTEETLDEVGMIVKDRALNQRFRDLIHQAIAEKESQMENENGNETIEPDLTMEIDKSLLMDNGDVIAEEDEEGEEEEKERKYARQLDDRDSHTTNGAARQHEYDYDTSVQLDVDHESMMQERSPPRLLDPEESLLEAMERTHLGEAKIVDLSKEATLSSEEASSGALMKVRE